jgi:DNA replication and repair protein RecF
VMISPYDRDLINDGSEIRRKYIDGVISQFDKIYLDDLILYQKALFQRNFLLKSFAEKKSFDQSLLEPWDVQLVALGEKIHARRKEFLEQFISVFRHYFSLIYGSDETVDIRYNSQLTDADFMKLLEECRERDRAAQFSTTGIHKDDLEFLFSGYPLKKTGSQGQQKSFLIAVKLAQFDYTRNKKGYKPILLLDDIFDKLDDLRVEQLIRLVSENNFGQVFITDTSEERIDRIFGGNGIDYKLFTLGKSG